MRRKREYLKVEKPRKFENLEDIPYSTLRTDESVITYRKQKQNRYMKVIAHYDVVWDSEEVKGLAIVRFKKINQIKKHEKEEFYRLVRKYGFTKPIIADYRFWNMCFENLYVYATRDKNKTQGIEGLNGFKVGIRKTIKNIEKIIGKKLDEDMKIYITMVMTLYYLNKNGVKVLNQKQIIGFESFEEDMERLTWRLQNSDIC